MLEQKASEGISQLVYMAESECCTQATGKKKKKKDQNTKLLAI